MTLTIDPNIADCGMDDAHAERRVSGQVRARAPTGSNAVILLNERSSQSQIVPKSRFQRPIKPETCSPLPSPTLASYIHQFPESRRWIIAPLMRCCPHRPLCMEVSFFHVAMTFLAGYPFWDVVTQNLSAWDVRGPILGQAPCQELWHRSHWWRYEFREACLTTITAQRGD